LNLNDKTVETCRACGIEKLGLNNCAGLVRFALKRLFSGE